MSPLYYGIAVLISITIWKCLKIFSHWSQKGVKQRCAYPIFGDTLSLLFQKHSFTEMVYEFYNRFPRERYSGIYQFFTPTLLLRDPELIKRVVISDFENFTDHLTVVPESCEPIWTKNLINMNGHHWKTMRATLTCTFTSSKIKRMVPLIADCSKNVIKYLDTNQNQDIIEIEIYDLFKKYTSNVIASCAFGFENDAFKDPMNDFFVAGQETTDTTSFKRKLQYLLYVGAPNIAQFLGVRLFSKNIADYYTTIVTETIKYREENNVSRSDLIQLLIDLKKENASEHALTDIEMTAQAALFIIAGYESVTTTMSFLAYELATNPEEQTRLKDEIDETLRLCNGNITFEAMQGMKYFDMALAECLRKWPAIVVTDRVVCKPYTITPENPHEKAIHLKTGDVVWIPICAIQRDPKYFPEPNKFIPDRFSAENKRKIQQCTYMPFGNGPRQCIGSRFAQIEIKTLFVHVLSKYDIVVVDKTVTPVKLSPTFSLSLDGGFWLGLKPRTM